MDYFQAPPSSSTSSSSSQSQSSNGGDTDTSQDGYNHDMMDTARASHSNIDPFSFVMPSSSSSTSTTSSLSKATTLPADEAADSATAMTTTATSTNKQSTSNNNPNSSNLGFREALMRRQGSSPSSFFPSGAATPRTPAAVAAHPLRASASSSGVPSTNTTTTSRWQKEHSGDSNSSNASEQRPALSPTTSSAATTSNSPKRSSMTSWLSKGSSSKTPPALPSSTSTSSSITTTRPSLSGSPSFFDSKPHSKPVLSRSSTSTSTTTTTKSNDRYSESPLDMQLPREKKQQQQNIPTSSNASNANMSSPGRPAVKSVSSSSSGSNSSNKTVTAVSDPNSLMQAGQGNSSSTSTTLAPSSTTTSNTVSTSPKEAPPSSSSSDSKQRSSLPSLPSLRMPFMGPAGGAGNSATGAAGKLPSGACGSLSLPMMKAGMSGARAGISRAFGGSASGALGRKGPEVIQNPRFKAIPVGEDLKTLLSNSTLPEVQPPSPTSAKSGKRLSPWIKPGDTLIVDLRPHTAFVGQGRLKGSINICVPSTLLRRPAFGMNKISETISCRRDQVHFERILGISPTPEHAATIAAALNDDANLKKHTKVIVLDQETVLLSQESTVYSLLNKIEKSGYSGDINWIRGGWNAISTHVESDSNILQEHVDMEEFVEEDEDYDDDWQHDEPVVVGGGDVPAGDSEMMNVQDTRTPRQSLPGVNILPTAAEASENASEGGGGGGGAYFQNSLQGPRGINTKGRSSQSSFTSTASSDSLFPSSVASSQSSMGSTADSHLSAFSANKERASSTSPVVPTFDSSKLHLPHLRPSTSPSPSTTSTPSLASSAHGKIRAGMSSFPGGGAGASLSLSSVSAAKTRSTSAGGTAVIRPKNLPMAAFQYNSTAQGGAQGDKEPQSKNPNSGKGHFQMGLDNANYGSSGTAGAASSGMEKSKSGSNPFAKKTAANPFFDNIRQNIESQSLDHVLEHVAPLEIPPEFTQPSLVKHLPNFLKDIIQMTPKTRASKLHKEYFDIEQAEQRRLQRVLNWHCQQSVVVDSRVVNAKAAEKAKKEKEAATGGDAEMDTYDKATYHPFSISAGVEKGHLNRYKNMWPYEHARVRLETVMSPTCGDYINASHIQLRGTSKRYIASQGPLEQTTEHFWRLVLQENVHVIVMLTLLQEGGREKCSNYFQSGTYGDIQINLLEEKGSEEAMKKSVCKDFGFFSLDEDVLKVDSPAAKSGETTSGGKQTFYASTPSQAADSVNMKRYSVETPSGKSNMQGHKRSLSRRLDSAIVRRTIEIRKRSDPPNTPPKTVRHIQYIKWPDFDIPPDPNVVIDLISETNKAQRDLDDVTGQESPVLVHCSAGVGRTGTFIAVDTLLERYRRERRAARTSGSPSNGPPRARVRRSGSDLGSTLGDLSLTDVATAKPDTASPVSAETPSMKTKGKEETQHVRPPALRSSSSTETPRHLQARLGIKDLLPEDHSDPILSLVDQMREQRMSSVANAGQYIFTYLALLAGISQELAEEGITAASPLA